MYARQVLEEGREGRFLPLPVDTIVAPEFRRTQSRRRILRRHAPDQMGLDIGPMTAEIFAGSIKAAQTVVWNGPMGIESLLLQALWPWQGHGRVLPLLLLVAGCCRRNQFGLASRISHINGEASLEFLEELSCPAWPVFSINKRRALMNRKYRKTVIAGNWKMNMLTSEVGYADTRRSSSGKVRH